MPHTPHTLPRHVAIIMDGNGRWAESRNLPRPLGHQAGAETVRRIVAHTRKLGIPYLTLYAFSTENWSRPRPEVDALMNLLAAFIDSELPTMMDNDVKLGIIGDTDRFSDSLRDKLEQARQTTARNRSLTLTLALNYGGRDEIVRAAQKAVRLLAASGRAPEQLDAETLAAHLDTAGMPDPDLIIRTAGEMRLSNFLVWQSAYAELLFTPRRWPEFSEADYDAALDDYAGRVRKFGGI
ncbi:MAG: isoprenyl transferase [Planctomycetota bacterium]|jgi:undecaprenyl diphosphate synthase|nr:isoprenyl transferase [Planctomycetota bacterium]